MSDIELLHIYGHEAWHDQVVIVGNARALNFLRDAITAALSRDGRGQCGVFTSDGEGYDVQVLREDAGWEDNAGMWRKLATPYRDAVARGRGVVPAVKPDGAVVYFNAEGEQS